VDLGRHHHVDWRALFARRGFRFFFLGIFVSLFGSGMNFAGVTWYILGKTNSTVQVSFMLILWMIPGLIVPFAGGILIDRLDRRYLGIAVDLLRGFVVGGVSALLFLDRAGLGAVYFMTVMIGIGSAIYWSNTKALVQEVIPSGQLIAANSAVLIAVQGGLAISGGFVGFVYNRAGISGILAIDAATYFVSALCLLLLRRGHVSPRAHPTMDLPAGLEAPLAAAEETALPPLIEPAVEPDVGTGFRAELKEGIAYLREQPAVLALGLTYSCMMAGVLSGNILVVALTKDILHAGATGFGLMESGWAVGAITGGLAVGILVRRFSPMAVLLAALITLSVGHLAFPYAKFLAIGIALHALFGACRALGGVLTQSGIMLLVPRRLMGRTQSAFAVFSTTLQVLISLSLGWLAEKVSLPFAFFILASLYGGAVLAALRARALAAPALPAPAVER
jgi:MFS family permease